MAVTYQSTQTASVNATAITITKPVSTAAGDLLIAHICCRGSVGTAVDMTSPPSGWTAAPTNGILENASEDPSSGIFYKIAGGSEPADYEFVFATGSSVNAEGAISRFTGPNLTTPVPVSEGQANGASTTATSPGITPPANSMLCMFVSSIDVTTSAYAIATSNPTWTERYDVSAGSASIAMATATRPEATATGNATATISSSDKNNANLLAIKPGDNISFSASLFTMTLFGFFSAYAPNIFTTTLSLLGITPQEWTNSGKHAGAFSNTSKNTASFSNVSKASSSWTNTSKS